MSSVEIDPNKEHTAREASVFLKCTEGTVKKYCRSGELAARQVSKKLEWRVFGSEIIKFREKYNIT
jgi:hypothetical protein